MFWGKELCLDFNHGLLILEVKIDSTGRSISSSSSARAHPQVRPRPRMRWAIHQRAPARSWIATIERHHRIGRGVRGGRQSRSARRQSRCEPSNRLGQAREARMPSRCDGIAEVRSTFLSRRPPRSESNEQRRHHATQQADDNKSPENL